MPIRDLWGLRNPSESLTIRPTMRSFYGYWWFTDGRRPA